MKMRAFGLTLLVLCVLGGLAAALLSPTLAATLTLPTSTPAVGQVATPAPPTVEPNAAATPQPTSLPNGVIILARDTFRRADQALWGQSSDGQIWNGDANTSSFFSIVNHAGQISGGQGPVQAIMSVANADAELLISGTVNQFAGDGSVNLGGVLRWQDNQNWYKALIDGNKLELLKCVQGKITSLKQQPFNAVDGAAYSLRLRVLGSNLFAKAWLNTQPEPARWMLLAIDTDLRSGSGGIRVFLANHTVIRIDTFIETNVPTAV